MSLAADDGRGNRKLADLTVNVLANTPPAPATPTVQTGNLFKYQPITFSVSVPDADLDPLTVTFDFGDGTTAAATAAGGNLYTATHVYRAAGLVNVTATADDAKGPSKITSQALGVTILENSPPVAVVSNVVSPADAPLKQNKAYTFTVTATDPNAGGNLTQLVWTFGDGTTLTQNLPVNAGPSVVSTATHTYQAPFIGTAAVQVYAIDSLGSVGDVSPATNFTVQATTLPVATFQLPAGPQSYNTEVGAATGVTVTYIVAVTNPNGAPGVYLPVGNVTLNPHDALANVQLPGTNNLNGTYTFLVSYGPSASAGARLTTPTITAVDLQGFTSSIGVGPVVTINTQAANHPPQLTLVSVPAIVAGTNATWQGVPVTFNASATDPDADAMTYTWDFGDGTTVPVAAVPAGGLLTQTHTFASANVYSVKLTVNDGRTSGLVSSTLSMNILANTAPTLGVTLNPVGNPYSLAPTTFTAAVSDANGDPVTVTWDFGDASPKVTGLTPVHTYLVVGPVNVITTADDGKGGVTVVTTPLTIQVNHAPVATVTDTAAAIFQSRAYTFHATATDSDAGDTIQSFNWDLGDGSPIQSKAAAGNASSVTYTYPTSFTGVAAVKAQAIDNHGAAGAYSPAVSFTVQATTLPVATFTAPAAPQTYTLETGVTNSVTVTYGVTSTNGTSGSFLPVADLTFNPGEAGAVLVSATDHLDGTYTYVYKYFASATAGNTRTVTPSVRATDTNNVVGLASSGPAITLVTANPPGVPSVIITAPVAPAINIYALQTATLSFTVTDPAADPLTYTVNWNDGSANATVTATLTGASLTAGVPVTLTHVFAQVAVSTPYTVTITAVDTRSGNNTASPVSRQFTVLPNALPTAKILTPQASGTLPALASINSSTPSGPVGPNNLSDQLKLPTVTNYPDVVVIPENGKLNFQGSANPSTSGEGLQSYLWTFNGGSPSSSNALAPGDVFFQGIHGQLTAYLVEFKATDVFGRSSSDVGNAPGANTQPFRKWVIVDGTNTQSFHLNLMYRQKSDNNQNTTLANVVSAANGLGISVQIFQDGTTNSWTVASANTASTIIPVRSDLPFWVEVPSFSASDPIAYMLRIPNSPNDPNYADSTLVTPATNPSVGAPSFTFANPLALTGPWDPTLNLVTAQGFAAENLTPEARKFQGTAASYMEIGLSPDNNRWVDRLSVPLTDASAIQLNWHNNQAIGFFDLNAYQSFAEWPILLMTEVTSVLSASDVTSAAGTSTDLGLNVKFSDFTGDTSLTKTYAAVGMEAYRIPGGVTDPYNLNTIVDWKTPNSAIYLGPTAIDPSTSPVPAFFQTAIYGDPGSTALQGGIGSFKIPYDPNDADRKVLAVPVSRSIIDPVTHNVKIRSTFSYSEYLWSSAWIRPLVLNNAMLNYTDSNNGSIATFPLFRYSKPSVNVPLGLTGAWPQLSGIPQADPNDSSHHTSAAFNLTPVGGPAFTADSPVAFDGAPAPATSVGRFYWTAFTPSYSSAGGALVSRSWLADASGQPPTTFAPTIYTVGTDASSAYGLIPPQDTVVDKRGRDASGNVIAGSLGGYRITWFNPTKQADGMTCVPPDFWVVEVLINGSIRTHYLLPAGFPTTQTTAVPILTDARNYLPSGNTPAVGKGANDTVAPGYCWFDLPTELRPLAGQAVTITVFGLKSILSNNPPPHANPRPLNRTEWIDAIKTATATVSITPSSGLNLSYAHKIPFNYAWDIVVVNGEATYVAP